MKITYSLVFSFVLIETTSATIAAPFQNLDFESVRTPLMPNTNDTFQRVSITDALPGWRGYIGSVEQTNVFYIIETLSAPKIALRESAAGFTTLQGNYSVLLGPSPMSSVSLSQNGHIPGDAQSLRFLGVVDYIFGPPMPLNSLAGVFVNGEQLTLTDAFSEPGIYNYSADISAFAGQDVTLTFTSFSQQYPNALYFDAISFSAVPIPEPSTFALFAFATFGWFYWRRRRR